MSEPPVDPQLAFTLALVDWTSAVALAKASGGVTNLVAAQEANDRFRIALNAYASSVPQTPQTRMLFDRVRGRIDSLARWLYGHKSGQITSPK